MSRVVTQVIEPRWNSLTESAKRLVLLSVSFLAQTIFPPLCLLAFFILSSSSPNILFPYFRCIAWLEWEQHSNSKFTQRSKHFYAFYVGFGAILLLAFSSMINITYLSFSFFPFPPPPFPPFPFFPSSLLFDKEKLQNQLLLHEREEQLLILQLLALCIVSNSHIHVTSMLYL